MSGCVRCQHENPPGAGFLLGRLAEPRGMRRLVAHCHLGLGKLNRKTGMIEQSREHLSTATTMYREMGMRYWLEQAELELKWLTPKRRVFLFPVLSCSGRAKDRSTLFRRSYDA